MTVNILGDSRVWNDFVSYYNDGSSIRMRMSADDGAEVVIPDEYVELRDTFREAGIVQIPVDSELPGEEDPFSLANENPWSPEAKTSLDPETAGLNPDEVQGVVLSFDG